MRGTKKAIGAATLALWTAVATIALTASGAGAVTGYHVSGTGGVGLRARTAPSTSAGVSRVLPAGSQLDIKCQDYGDNVGGSRIWDQLQDGAWITDYYTSTPVYAGFSPGIPRCGAAPQGGLPASARNIGYNPFAARYSNQCTYYAEQRMANQTGRYMPVYGNAYQWADQARAGGWTVGTAAAVNSVVVFPRGAFGSSVGHVAWVVDVSGGRIRIQDYNWNWSGAHVTDHWVTVPGGTQYIYSNR